MIAWLVTSAACSTPTAPDGPTLASPPPASASAVAAAIVSLTNQERTWNGLGPLRTNAQLAQVAQLQADQTARLRVLEHILPSASYPTPEDRLAAAGYRWQAYGENLASGQRDATLAMSDWMNSSSHRANILNPVFTEIGAAFAVDVDGRPYYVEVFGKPR